jgi:cysteine synthase
MHRTLIEAYNGKTVMVRHKENGSFQIARINKVKQLAKKIKNSFVPNQYSNAMNPRAHYESTAKELIQDLDGKIDYLVAAVSTGGTISGNARKLKEKIKNIKIVAVDSVGSVIFGGKPKPRFMTGMGANFTPTNLDLSIIDKVIKVSDRDAFKTCKELSKKEGILVGGSSGAAVCAALKLAKNNLQKEKNIVVIAPDAGNFYLDTFFSKNWCRKNSIF